MGRIYRRLRFSIFVAIVCGSPSGCSLLIPHCAAPNCELPTGASEVNADDCKAFGEDCFRMAVVGDSIAWGNGLAESERFWSRLTGTIEDETGKKVHRQVFAFTRARLGDGAETDEEPRPNETGEVPRYRPSIFEQLDFIDDPELQDLILVSGCINDVSFTNIINPFQNSQELSQLVDKFCLNSMKELLDELRTRA